MLVVYIFIPLYMFRHVQKKCKLRERVASCFFSVASHCSIILPLINLKADPHNFLQFGRSIASTYGWQDISIFWH